MNTNLMFSSQTDQWATPIDFFNMLNNIYYFTLDPCADEYNHKCPKYYTKEQNGLLQDWYNEIVFCNPPYGREIYNWVEKCWYESTYHNAICVMLIPARTDTRYFHNFIYNNRNAEVYFIKGRLKFGNSNNAAPFPSMVVVFKNNIRMCNMVRKEY